jgi:aspartyl-tRNA(Asn)/glutamyl-tRNA(Gln) amidotransferase subunit A
MFDPLQKLSDALAGGETTSVALTDRALAAIADKSGQGGKAFIEVFAASARAEAEASDAQRATGRAMPALSGIPISIKDLFDVQGQITRAGSKVRADASAATTDAPILTRLRAAGAVIVGRTNMTEFAFSGLGLNPHYGTPLNPHDRATGRIPGGSSSGAAISVTDGMAAAGIGTDTGGSVRIPSGLCGLTGFKPTARRVPTDGAFPLSVSLDSIGPLARSVACCALLDQIMSASPVRTIAPLPVRGLRLGVPQSFVLVGMDDATATAFNAALRRLSAAGAQITEIPFSELLELPTINAKGGFAASEAYSVLRGLLANRADEFDPRVGIRVQRGAGQDAADYIDLLAARRDFQARADAVTRDFDAIALPTTPIVSPPLAALETDDDLYQTTNMAMLRNSSVGNFLDRCAISLPCHEAGTAPVGLMLMGETMGDERLLSVAAGVEAAL